MISAEVIEKYKQVERLMCELDKAGIFDISGSGAHMTVKEFLRHFKEFRVRKFSSYNFPFELQADVDGITFFCLLNNEEAVKIRRKINKMQKLEKESASEDKPND